MNLSFLKNRKLIIGIWLAITLITAIKQFLIAKYNNYLIFKNVFYHTLEENHCMLLTLSCILTTIIMALFLVCL